MKKIWIIIVAVLLAAVLGVLVLARTAPSKATDSGDTDSLYPYSFQETKQGTLVTVTGSFPDGCRWTAESLSKGVAAVSEKKQNTRKASFLITPVSWGSTSVVLSLEKGSDTPAERIYELDIGVSVSSDRILSVTESGHREPLGITGKTENYTYWVIPNADGSLELYADNNTSCSWILQVDGSTVAATAVWSLPSHLDESDMTHYTLTAISSGKDTVRLCSDALGQAVEIEAEADSDGRLTVSGHQIVEYVYVKDDIAAACAEEYVRLLGDPVLPNGAQLISSSTMFRVSESNGAEYSEVGCLEFTLGGQTWMLYGSDTATTADLFAGRAASASGRQVISANGRSAVVYDHADGAFAGWQSASGRSWLLEGENASADDAAAAAEKILKVIA